MSKELAVRDDTQLILSDLENTKKICAALMATKHYQKMGEMGIFAIVQKARSMDLNPIECLNGDMYFVQGKVELSAILMAKLIRQQKHSITMDKSSNDSICILHGKRADNGDTWRASFSIDDAKRAGLIPCKPDSSWYKYPGTMCYNRALSKLARQLFPDVIGNCYVEGEISGAPGLFERPEELGLFERPEELGLFERVVEADLAEEADSVPCKSDSSWEKYPDTMCANMAISKLIEKAPITDEQAKELDTLIGSDDEFRATVMDFIQKRFKGDSLSSIPRDMFEAIRQKIVVRMESQKEKARPSEIAQNVLLNNSPKDA